MKRCNTCGSIKPYSEFHLSKGSRDGFRNRCKECRKKVDIVKKRKKLEHLQPYKDNVVNPICQYYKCAPRSVFTSQEARFTTPKIVVYMKLKKMGLSAVDIGEVTGRKHSTILHMLARHSWKKEFCDELKNVNVEVFKCKIPIKHKDDKQIKQLVNDRKPIKEIAELTGYAQTYIFERIKLLIKENGVKKLPQYSGTKKFRKVIN